MGIDLDVRQLRVIVSVFDSGGYTAASEALFLSQSSISRTVFEVERKVGVRLFDRTTRRVEATPDGRQLVAIARRLLAEFDAAMSHFQGYLEGTEGAVSVATLASIAGNIIPTILAHYQLEHPKVSISVQDAFASEVFERVVSGSVDFAVAAAPEPIESLSTEQIAADQLFAVFSRNHRFNKAVRITWEDFSSEPFIAFDPASSIRTHVDTALARVGARLGSVIEARDIGAVAGLVAAGLGVSVVPALVLPMVHFAGVRHRLIEDPVQERGIFLIRDQRRPLSLSVVGLMDAFRLAAVRGFVLPSGVRWTSEL